jgi:SAM-dependent methyltransferase
VSSGLESMYGHGLAYIHHVGFGDSALQASAAIVAMLRAAGHVSGSVVDLGCGTGIVAKAITEAGFEALGIDVSPSMIALAERHAPRARFKVGSLHDCELPPCVAVCAIGESLGYLAPGEERIDLRPLAARVRYALAPGGLFVFDVIEAAAANPMSYRASRSGPDWEVRVEVTEDLDHSVVTRAITALWLDEGSVRTTSEVHRVQTFKRTEVEGLLVDGGFRVETTDRYGSVPLSPRRMALVARKPRGDSGA